MNLTLCKKGPGQLAVSAALAAAILLQLAAPVSAATINKCVVEGKVTYQDTPCENQETVGQWVAKQEHYESLYQKLDQLAALGHGMVQRPAPKPPAEPAPTKPSEKYVPQPKLSYAARLARDKEEGARLQAQTEQRNAESAAWLTQIIGDMKKQCGGKFAQYPAIGMTDADFRNCTVHARFGGLKQLVVSEDGDIPLRLYIYSATQASRVYSIGGVVTAIRP